MGTLEHAFCHVTEHIPYSLDYKYPYLYLIKFVIVNWYLYLCEVLIIVGNKLIGCCLATRYFYLYGYLYLIGIIS